MTSEEIIKLLNHYGLYWALISFLLQLLITGWFKLSNDKKLASYQAKLEILTSENSIRFTKTFDTQSEVMATLYAKIINLTKVSRDFAFEIGGNTPEKDRKGHVLYNASRQDFLDYFMPNELYITEETSVKINRFLMDTDRWLSRHGYMMATIDLPQPSNEQREKRISTYEKEIDELIQSLVAIRQDIYKDFQKHLGIRK